MFYSKNIIVSILTRMYIIHCKLFFYIQWEVEAQLHFFHADIRLFSTICWKNYSSSLKYFGTYHNIFTKICVINEELTYEQLRKWIGSCINGNLLRWQSNFAKISTFIVHKVVMYTKWVQLTVFDKILEKKENWEQRLTHTYIRLKGNTKYKTLRTAISWIAPPSYIEILISNVMIFRDGAIRAGRGHRGRVLTVGLVASQEETSESLPAISLSCHVGT